MSKLRVLRIIEYTYDSAEDMEADMTSWNMPANGIRTFRTRVLMRSTVLPMEVLDND